jgi:hypothetical protein
MKPPAGMATDTFSSAVTAPRSLMKRTVALSRRTAGSAGILMSRDRPCDASTSAPSGGFAVATLREGDLGGSSETPERYPILGRAAAVAWRIESVITSLTFGAGPLN